MNLEKLKELRKANKLSQENMARRLDLSLRGYQVKERGETEFTVSELVKLSDILEVEVTELVK